MPDSADGIVSYVPNEGNEGGIIMKRKILAASLAVLSLSSGAFCVEAADMPVYTLDGIVVTASRVPEKKIDSNADVSVVTSKEIEEKHYDDVSEAIRHVPGVMVGSQGASGRTSFTNPLLINGSENVVVMVDGMRMNTNGTMGGHAPIATLTNMEGIDRIEVLKGAASTLYGSDAEGWVINIITNKPAEGTVKSRVTLSRSSYDGEKYSLYNEGRKDGFFWAVNAQKELMGEYKDGWDRHVINHLNSKSYGVKLGYDFGNDNDLIFNYQKYDGKYTRPDYGTNDKTKDLGKQDTDRISLQYDSRINQRLTNRFSMYRNRNHINDNYNNAGSSGITNIRMKTIGMSDQLVYRLDKQTITGGVDWYQDEVPYDANYWGHSSMEGHSVTNTGYYVQDKWDINDRWNVTPGIRFDHNSQYGNHTSPSLTVGYKAGEATNYYISYKKFFRAPSLMQLYYPGGGNPNLDPETGYTVELGAAHRFNDTLSGSLSVYRQWADNQIKWGENEYVNTAKMINTGVNASLNKDFGAHVTASLGYSYIHADTHNLNFSYLPKHELHIDVDYHNADFRASVSGRGIVDRYISSGCPAMKDYASFWVWDLNANYRINKEASLFVKVNNIFDQFYTDIGSFYGSSANPAKSQGWYSAPGRNFEIGMQFTF